MADPTPSPGEPAPVTREHRTSVSLALETRHLPPIDVINWIQTGDTPAHLWNLEKAAQLLATHGAAESAAGAAESVARIVSYLRAEAEHYKHNRNIGPYAAELADLFERGEFKNKEPFDV